MTTYLVTLTVETDQRHGDPAGWEWHAVLDTPHAVGVVASVEGPDAPAARGWMLGRAAGELLTLAAAYHRNRVES